MGTGWMSFGTLNAHTKLIRPYGASWSVVNPNLKLLAGEPSPTAISPVVDRTRAPSGHWVWSGSIAARSVRARS